MDNTCRILILGNRNTYTFHDIEAGANDVTQLALSLEKPHGVEDALDALGLAEMIGHARFSALVSRFIQEEHQAREAEAKKL